MTSNATTTGLPARRSSTRSPTLVVAALATVLLAAVGITLAVSILRPTARGAAGRALADPAAGDLALGQPARTSFGSLLVSAADLNNGLSSEDLGGMSHGVSSLVSTGSAQVNVVVTLTNTSHRPVPVAAGQFRLLTARPGVPPGGPVAAQATTIQAGSLPPGASVDARVTFVTATDGSRLWLQYTDPSGIPIRAALGRTAEATAPPAHGH